MNKIELNWIPQLFENYKNKLKKQYWEIEHRVFLKITGDEFYYKTLEADELLEEIKQFIKDANDVAANEKPHYKIVEEKALATMKATQEANKKICEIGACVHPEHHKKD